jgi:hypothetical protein
MTGRAKLGFFFAALNIVGVGGVLETEQQHQAHN